MSGAERERDRARGEQFRAMTGTLAGYDKRTAVAAWVPDSAKSAMSTQYRGAGGT